MSALPYGMFPMPDEVIWEIGIGCDREDDYEIVMDHREGFETPMIHRKTHEAEVRCSVCGTHT